MAACDQKNMLTNNAIIEQSLDGFLGRDNNYTILPKSTHRNDIIITI